MSNDWKAAGYTHRITLERLEKHLGWQPQHFHTTRDAVIIHLACLRKQTRAGSVRNVRIRKI